MRKKTVLLMTIFLTVAASAFGRKNEKLPVLMHEFYGTLAQMKPYMASLDEFQNPQNKTKVLGLLQGLEKKIDRSEVSDLNSPSFNATYNLFAKHLRDTSYLYEKELYDTAWNKLRATTQFCIACHDRLPKLGSKMNWQSPFQSESKDPESRLREADFLYIGHQYEASLAIYDQIIRQFKSDLKKPELNLQLDVAYQRKIAYFARLQRNPEAAIESLKTDLKNENLPLETKKNIESWIHYFGLWKKEGGSDPSKLSDANLVEFARDVVDQNAGGRRIAVSDPYVVNLLRVSGLLYERAFKKSKSSSTPEILFLLGKCEKDLAPIRPYSLADVYFRDCVLQAPQSEIAKKCFSEYEMSIRTRFRTGASEYIDASLEELRKLMRATNEKRP